MKFISVRFSVLVLLSLICLVSRVFGDDWPTYQHDNARSAVTQEQLTFPLKARWTFASRHAPESAWSDPATVPEPQEKNLELPRLDFDKVFHVISANGNVYFGSSADHRVYCLDMEKVISNGRFVRMGRYALRLPFGKIKSMLGAMTVSYIALMQLMVKLYGSSRLLLLTTRF